MFKFDDDVVVIIDLEVGIESAGSASDGVDLELGIEGVSFRLRFALGSKSESDVLDSYGSPGTTSAALDSRVEMTLSVCWPLVVVELFGDGDSNEVVRSMTMGYAADARGGEVVDGCALASFFTVFIVEYSSNRVVKSRWKAQNTSIPRAARLMIEKAISSAFVGRIEETENTFYTTLCHLRTRHRIHVALETARTPQRNSRACMIYKITFFKLIGLHSQRIRDNIYWHGSALIRTVMRSLQIGMN